MVTCTNPVAVWVSSPKRSLRIVRESLNLDDGQEDGHQRLAQR